MAGIYIIYRRYEAMQNPNVNEMLNYGLMILFIAFTYINLRKLIKLIKEYKE